MSINDIEDWLPEDNENEIENDDDIDNYIKELRKTHIKENEYNNFELNDNFNDLIF